MANSTPYQYDFFLRYIIAGHRALWSETSQENYTGRFDGTWKPATVEKGVGALTGNPDLEPEKTRSFEMSLKYGLPHGLVGSITYFKKETTNQIDTKTFIPADSKLAGSFGFAEFVNNPYGKTSGIELVLSRERGAWLTGEFSYTYMTTEGVSGNAYDGYYIAQYGLPPSQRVFPLSWDQTHTFKIAATVSTPQEFDCTVLAEYLTGRPYTNYPTSTGFEKIDGGAFLQNNARMPDYLNIDVKLVKYFKLAWWEGSRLTAYVDVRNLLNKWNVKWMDSNGIEGGELHDPSGFYPGRRTMLGLQAEF